MGVRRVRTALLISLACWLLCVLTWAGLLASEATLGCPEFSAARSDHGEAQWVWSPPGNRCIYTLSEGVHIEDPATARYGILGLLVLWPVSNIVIAAAGRRSRPSRGQP